MSELIVAVRPGEASLTQRLLKRFAAAVTILPDERDMRRFRAVLPEQRMHAALTALRADVPSLQLCAISDADETDAPDGPICFFRALSEPSPRGDIAAHRLFGFKNGSD